MSAEILRKAASLMRERAEAALSADHVGDRWVAAPRLDPENNGWRVDYWPEFDGFDSTLAVTEYDYEGSLARHLSGWHPAVALALADWLAECARLWEYGDVGPLMWKQANVVARAYLGADA